MSKLHSTNTQTTRAVSYLGNIPNTETRLEHLALTLIQPIAKVSRYLKGDNHENIFSKTWTM